MSEIEDALRVEAVETSPVVRTLEVEVDAERVNKAFDRAYRDLARRVRVRGFRPGRTPRAVLERLYGATVSEELERALVGETLPEALQRAGLAPVSEPAVDAGPPHAGVAFRYKARIEVKPEIPLGEVRGLPGKRPALQVAETDVLTELESLRERHARLLEEPAETVIAESHVVNVDFVGRIGGKPFEGGSGQDVEVEIGSGRFLPGFEEQLVGKRSGDDVEVRVRFPEEYRHREVAGREAVFQVHVGAVRRRELPELDDEFAKDLGDFESIDALRQKVREELGKARERDAREALTRSLLDALIERTPFEVPAGMVERRLRARLRSAQRQLESALDAEALRGQLARWEEEWRPLAEREVREALLLEAVGDRESIEVEDALVEERLRAIAQREGADLGRLRESWTQQGLLESLRAQLRDEQVLDFLVREAKVEEVTGS